MRHVEGTTPQRRAGNPLAINVPRQRVLPTGGQPDVNLGRRHAKTQLPDLEKTA